MFVDYQMPKTYLPITAKAVCYYRDNDRPSNKLFTEYSLSGIIVQAKDYFPTDCMIIDKILLCDPISGGIIHTEIIEGPGKPEPQLAVEQWFEKRKEERSFLARYNHPFAQQPA